MSYTYLTNIKLEEALKTYLDSLKNSVIMPGVEEIPVKSAFGRVTSEAVFAIISSPHYNSCAMDGIAICAGSTFGATDTTPVALKEGEDFIRVDTGDPLPDRFDAVIMIEDVIETENGRIKILNSAVPWQHVRQIGEDICAGEMILTCKTSIEPAAIGAMLAGGVQKVKVIKKPVVGIIPTGDEIVPSTVIPKAGEIIESNSAIFSAMLEKWGALAKIYEIMPNKCDMIIKAIKNASEECDMVLLNAGSSAGREDFSARALREAGEVYVHGIAIKPGKPTILGLVGKCPVIGIPGYPVSGIIVMEKLVKHVLEFLTGIKCEEGRMTHAVLSKKLVSSLKYREFVRVKLGNVGGKLIATPLNRGAGVITSFVKADGLLDIPLDTEGYEAGAQVEVQLLKSIKEIENTLVVIGSHDPLIDIVSDIMRRVYPGKFISSAHVGSISGIMAVKRGEAHLAGIHLLDADTGEYNVSYIKKYFPNEKIVRISCVNRIQGLMVQPGNPAFIKDLGDLSSKGLKYVNRQKGSGTRILFDYLLGRNSISTGSIHGYEREEFTHMSVAALVASGSANAGMGIFAAAKAFGLDFIPMYEEQYEFIMPERFLNLESVGYFIKILSSDEFKNSLERLGGYKIENSGKCLH